MTSSARTQLTKDSLIKAAVAVLQRRGFAAATARAIADEAGSNQGLIFYHFGSVTKLLLAALDFVSAERENRYSLALANTTSTSELAALAAMIFTEDLDRGDTAVLVEMLAGCSSTPGLGSEVKARIEPWTEFAARAVETAIDGTVLDGVVKADEIAHVVVALYLGLELLSHLDGDRTQAIAIFERAKTLAPLLDNLSNSASLSSKKMETT